MPKQISRQDFLRSSPLLATAAALPGWMPRLVFTPINAEPRGDILVVIFLRGAADALNMLIPYGEEAYYTLRPTLGIARPDDPHIPKTERAINLDGFFGLHPMMSKLLPLWQEGHLSFVHACGAPDESRSHFKAQELMERGTQDENGPASGWIGRHLATYDSGNLSPLRTVGVGTSPPRSLSGAGAVFTLRSKEDFSFAGNEHLWELTQEVLAFFYSGDDPTSKIGRQTLEILAAIQKLTPVADQPSSVLGFPESEFGLGLQQLAMLIKAQIGLEVATLDLGGWDTHFAQGSNQGLMANLMRELAEGLVAFYTELHEYAGKLTIITMSEFGRRAYENGSLGTDHGHGGLMMLLGGHVTGGKVHGDWPGLEREQLFGPGDLAVTTDYRDVLAELCLKRLKNPALEQIFPGHTLRNLGILNPESD